MKRLTALFLSVLFLFALFFSSATAGGLEYRLNQLKRQNYLENYAAWASQFGIAIDQQTSQTEPDENGLNMKTMDAVTLYTNPDTNSIEKLTFFYRDVDAKETDEQTLLKVIAFLCAVEVGEAQKKTNEALDTISPIGSAIDALTDSQYQSIRNGKHLLLYKSENGTYTMRCESRASYVIYFVPSDEEPTAPTEAPTEEQAELSPIQRFLAEDKKWNDNFLSETKSRMKEYYNTTLDDFSLSINDECDSIIAMNIRFTWSVDNSAETTKKMLEMFSDDLAATLHNKYPDMPIEQLVIFWKVPKLYEKGYAAKYYYSSSGDKIYHTDSLGPLYGKN